MTATALDVAVPCDMCGEVKKTVERVPSRKTLIMGPYPGSFYFNSPPHFTYENRCEACETKLAKQMNQMLKE